MQEGLSDVFATALAYSPREWLEQQISRWLSSSSAPRTFALLGGPGTGKSRFLSAIVARVDSNSMLGGINVQHVILRDPAGQVQEFSWQRMRDSLADLKRPVPPVWLNIHVDQKVVSSDNITAVQVPIYVSGNDLHDLRNSV